MDQPPTTFRVAACGSPGCRAPARARSRTSWSTSCARGAARSSCSTATRCASTCRRASDSRRPTATRTSCRIGCVASVLARNGVVAVTAAISPYRAVRDEVRGWIDNFVEIHVATPLEECEARDVKGLYAKARAGEIPEFTGVSDPYEPPLAPEISIETDRPHPGRVRRRGRRLARRPPPRLTHEVGDGVAPGLMGRGEGNRERAVGDALVAARLTDRRRRHAGRGGGAEHRSHLLGGDAARPPSTPTPRTRPRPAVHARAPGAVARSTRNPVPPPNAISHSATASPPSLTSCTPATSRSPHEVGDELVESRRGVEIRDGRARRRRGRARPRPTPSRRAPARVSPSTTIVSPVAQSARPAAAPRSSSIRPSTPDDRRRVDVGPAATRCRS